jgi:hypothetical protein
MAKETNALTSIRQIRFRVNRLFGANRTRRNAFDFLAADSSTEQSHFSEQAPTVARHIFVNQAKSLHAA